MSVGDGVRASRHGIPARTARALAIDRTSLGLFAVFVLAAVLYLWTAGTTLPLALSGAEADPYNQLANAFLHFHLSVGPAPAGLLRLSEPYNPSQNGPFQQLTSPLHLGIHDFSLYRGKLFLTWGPAPVVVLLVPLHVLGFAPTASVTVSVFSIVGLGFALLALHVVIRQIGTVPLWMCVLAALTLALSSAVPFILRRPAVYEESIAGGYCFAMAAIWLAISALASRRASVTRLALMSLCVGLATASRPSLAVTAAVIPLVYLSLRTIRPHRGLLMALILPVGVCILLLLVYNQARFGNPLENGAKYQLAGFDQNAAPFDDLSYVPPGLWFYGVSAPRIASLFPFVVLTPPPFSYPGSLPGLYRQQLEATGGLLPMAPIVILLAALPAMWRRRTSSLGALSLPLLTLACAGIACVLFLSYVFFSTTERYEVDFTTLLLLGAVAAWLALSNDARGWRRRLVRIGGGLLAAWSCVAGLAISFTGYYNLLATTHPGTWRTLEDIGSPVSRAIASFAGHPVLAESSIPAPALLSVGEQDEIVIVSADTRKETLLAAATPAVRVGEAVERAGHASALLVRGPGHVSTTYRVAADGEKVPVTVQLSPGLNRLTLTALAADTGAGNATVPASRQLLALGSMSLTNQQ
jgi:hypothetical protein